MKWSMLVLLVATLTTVGCSRNKPPNLTPDASLAYDNGQVVNAIDDGRDVAIITNSFTGVPFSTPIVRRIVTAHASALVLIDQRTQGWDTQVPTILDELLKNISGDAAARIKPYVDLTKTLLSRLKTRDFDEPLSAEIVAAFREQLARSAAVDTAWLAAHK